MQLHEKDLAMSLNFRVFSKTNYSYLSDTYEPTENIVFHVYQFGSSYRELFYKARHSIIVANILEKFISRDFL